MKRRSDARSSSCSSVNGGMSVRSAVGTCSVTASLAQHAEDAAHDLALQRLALAALRKSAERVAALSAAARAGFAARASARGLGARRSRARRELLARRLGVDPRAVLRQQRRRLRRAVDVVGRRHPRRAARAAACGRPASGTPFSARIVTAASPMPERRQQLLEVVELGLRERRDRRPQRLRVVGREGAQRVLDAVAELREDVAGTSFGVWVTKNDADALGADQPHGLLDDCRGTRRSRSSNSRCASSKKNDELRLGQVARLGQRLEQLGDQPHQRGREELRLVLHGGQLEARDDAAAVGGDAHAGRRCRAAARRRTRCRRPSRARRARAAARRPSATTGRRCPRARPCPRRSPGTSAARAGRRGRAAAGPWSRRSGRRARGSAPASRWPRGPWRAAAARSPRPSRAPARPGRCRRARGTRPGRPSGAERQARARRRASRPAPPGSPGAASPDTSPLTSATNTGTPAAESCSAMHLQRLRLAGAGRAGDRARGGSSSPAGPARRASGCTSPSCTPRPRSIAGPSTA